MVLSWRAREPLESQKSLVRDPRPQVDRELDGARLAASRHRVRALLPDPEYRASHDLRGRGEARGDRGTDRTAWLLLRDEHVLLIPGTSSLTHLEENMAAARIALDDEDLAALDGVSRPQAANPHARR